MKNNDFSALLIVVFVAFACMGAVSTIGNLIVTAFGKPPTVECTVIMYDSNRVKHEYVGKGELYD